MTTTAYRKMSLFGPSAASRKCKSGEARKQERLTLLQQLRAVHIRRGQHALLARLLAGETATADDGHRIVELPPDIDPRCLGAVPGPLAKAGIIRSNGFVKSTRPKRHASPTQEWILADPAAAVAWLDSNPVDAEEASC